jgi:hypothetical protein
MWSAPPRHFPRTDAQRTRAKVKSNRTQLWTPTHHTPFHQPIDMLSLMDPHPKSFFNLHRVDDNSYRHAASKTSAMSSWSGRLILPLPTRKSNPRFPPS